MALSLVLRNGSKLNALPRVSQNILANGKLSFSNGSSNGFIMNTNLLRSHLITQKVVKRTMSGDHAKTWKLEKILTIIMFPIIPATFSNPGTEILDNLFAILVTTHAHFGLEAIARDYVRPILVGPILPKIAVGLVYALTSVTLGSLLYFNHHNIGIGAAGRKIWSIGKTEKEIPC
ncbi:hypothetical protein HHI36_003422 [Cryptolaemus montrouzieri]|uniref:Succinate dehydrogenase [ubiquinone] cytochrome b small subunit n=1 Tax=Cryptolaemus montrouzieri TaxID=559131 RepID=A0ABD2PDC4_9CUCU